MRIKNFIILAAACGMLIAGLSGCATVPSGGNIISYNINGVNYLPLAEVCALRGINLRYDTFSRIIYLDDSRHKISLMPGDNLALIDGLPRHLKYPVSLYRGKIVVPRIFKETVIDPLFKQAGPGFKPGAFTIKKVVIDPGHGGFDPGAIGKSGLREKDVNLDIARRLVSLLRSAGIEVVMTRSTDKFVSLDSRVRIANNSRAGLFVSIHANANRVRSLKGFEAYYVSEGVNDSKRAYAAAKEAPINLERAYFAGSSLDLKAILWDMAYTYNRAQSILLSRAICRSMNDNLDLRILGIKGARYQVLKEARIPAVLVEVGFLSNYNEERMLKNNFYRQQLAQSIAQGITEGIRQ